MKKITIALIIYSLPIILQAMNQSDISNLFMQTDKFLKSYVENGSVDYPKIIANRNELNEIVRVYENIALDEIQSDVILKAFWTNA
ncbi:MAG: hypothetical protein R3250_17300, partial [Melioribacteraceae bacterium]|nr:hypothetical protein [Melioribacteraceae bacterium]